MFQTRRDLAIAARDHAKHQERQSIWDRRPYRIQNLNFGFQTAAQHWKRDRLACPVRLAVARILLVSSASCPAAPCAPSRSVAAGCHNSPATPYGPPVEGERISSPSLEDAFRSEREKLLRYMGRRVGQDMAPDMVQEVFTRAAGSEQASRLVNPVAFIRRIARNLLIDRARRRKHSNVILFPFDEERHLATPPDQAWNIEATDLFRHYEAAVDALPEKTRRVFLMHRVDELSYRQIHEQLGISVATVEYHMMKALAHIARWVDAAK